MRMIALLAAAALAVPLHAEEKLRELCSDRPGLDTLACTVDRGHLQAEIGFADWTLDRQADSRTDTLLIGDALLRYGMGNSTELRLGWTPYGHVRERDRTTGTIDRTSGIGDVTVGIKQNLLHPDGRGFSLALLPYASLPTGRSGVGAGDWAAGLLIPLDYDLSDRLTLELTPEIDAAVDQDGNGRHAAYGSAGGIAVKLSDKFSISVEGQLIRDRDPADHVTQALAGIYLTWQPKDRLQFDAGAQSGLNRSAPDVELYLGVTEKF